MTRPAPPVRGRAVGGGASAPNARRCPPLTSLIELFRSTQPCRSMPSSRPMTFAASIRTRSTRRWRARIGNAFAHFTGAQHVLVGRDMRASSMPLSRAFIEGATHAPAPMSPISACARPTSCTSRRDASTLPVRCSRPVTTLRSTTASSCVAPARLPSARHTGLMQIKELVASGVTSARRGRRQGRAARHARRVRRARALVRRPRRAPAAQGRGRHRKRHGRPRRARRCSKACRST